MTKKSVGWMLLVAGLLAVCCVCAQAETDGQDAVSFRQGIYEELLDMEWELDSIEKFPPQEKYRLLCAMQELGFSFDAPPLPDEAEAEKAYNAVLEAQLGRLDAVSVLDVMEKTEGPMPLWTLEMKAWYGDYLVSRNRAQGTWRDVLPGDDDLSREEAVEIARAAICQAFSLQESDLDERMTAVDFFTRDGKAPRWRVSFYSGLYSGADYEVLLDREGQITFDPDLGILTPEQAAAAQ